ncbi:hypothetical protein AB4225_36765 [Streptomyces sp. 2RAF24]|uniref:hypothetical protein n=1 Tax=unclassified Streptomyces TaxID=2593676 RepID=UPI0033FD4345
MRPVLKRTVLGSAALTSALVVALAGPASATSVNLYGLSSSKNAEVSGGYEWHAAGTAGGYTYYAGSFSYAGARDAIPNNKLEAVLALEFDTWANGAWTHKNRYASRVNTFDSWSFNYKKNIRVWACDREIGTTALLNCLRVY